MTDNEIIELLNECDTTHIKIRCAESILSDTRGVIHLDLSKIVDILNRQQAEIERLCVELDEVIIAKDLLFDEAEALIKKTKTEAVKEFAEKIKSAAVNKGYSPYIGVSMLISDDIINKIIKEMVGEAR